MTRDEYVGNDRGETTVAFANSRIKSIAMCKRGTAQKEGSKSLTRHSQDLPRVVQIIRDGMRKHNVITAFNINAYNVNECRRASGVHNSDIPLTAPSVEKILTTLHINVLDKDGKFISTAKITKAGKALKDVQADIEDWRKEYTEYAKKVNKTLALYRDTIKAIDQEEQLMIDGIELGLVKREDIPAKLAEFNAMEY
jgi:hypothetical protein